MTVHEFVSPRMIARYRVLAVAAGTVLIGLLVTAARLEPDPSGLGTHQQLGLAPCTFRQVFGIRCPACGMTTSWAHFTRGQLVSALSVNTGGALLAVVSTVLGPWLLVSGLRGRWLWRPLGEWTLAIASLVAMLVILADWLCRLLAGWESAS